MIGMPDLLLDHRSEFDHIFPGFSLRSYATQYSFRQKEKGGGR